LAGPIPPELGKLAALKEIRLYSNQLTGEICPIPPELGGLSALQHLDLRYNELSGELPHIFFRSYFWMDTADASGR
ncbi:unnamed protein product, partial [Ectocarpus fasciculatus]